MILTAEQIDTWRVSLMEANEDQSDLYISEVNSLCDMALASITPAEARRPHGNYYAPYDADETPAEVGNDKAGG